MYIVAVTMHSVLIIEVALWRVTLCRPCGDSSALGIVLLQRWPASQPS